MDTPTESVPTSNTSASPAPETTPQADAKVAVQGYLTQFETWLEQVMVTKAPFQIPMGGKEFIATIAPYLAILGVVFCVLSLPALLGLGVMTAGLGMLTGHGFGYTMLVSLVSTLVVAGFEAFAIPGLFKRSAGAWHLMFYATIASVAGQVLAFNLIGAVIGGLIGWYLLFQVKALYKN